MTKFKKIVKSIQIIAELLIPIGWAKAIKELKETWK